MGNTRARRAYIAIAQYGAYRGYVLVSLRAYAAFFCRAYIAIAQYGAYRGYVLTIVARIRRDFYEGESIDVMRSSRRRVARGSDMELLSFDRAHKTAVNGAFYLTF